MDRGRRGALRPSFAGCPSGSRKESAMQTERPTPVPLCDLQTQYQALRPEIEAAVLRVLASGQAILGSEVAALEREVADYCGTDHAVGCGSGTDALSLAFAALGIGPGDEVVMPPFTFFATAGSVVRLGARPVFADIDPVTLQRRSGSRCPGGHAADEGSGSGPFVRTMLRHGRAMANRGRSWVCRSSKTPLRRSGPTTRGSGPAPSGRSPACLSTRPRTSGPMAMPEWW